MRGGKRKYGFDASSWTVFSHGKAEILEIFTISISVEYNKEIVSTSRGLLPDSEARKRKLGGELICEVWSWVGSATNQSKYLKKWN